MDYTFYIHGGLGDFFCYMHMDEFKDHPLQLLKALKEQEPESSVRLNIYSANPDSAELFRYSPYVDYIVEYKPDEYVLTNVDLPVTKRSSDIVGLSEEEKEFYMNLVGKKVCVFHPFTLTPYKSLPSKVDKKEFIDVMIDKYGYTAVILKSKEEILDYDRNGLIKICDHFSSISRLGFWITGRLASKIIAIDSAYLMLRNSFLPLKEQSTLALLWDKLYEDHRYHRGLNTPPNMYITYPEITDVEKLIDSFMEERR